MKKLANILLLITATLAFLFNSCAPEAPKEAPGPDLDQIKAELQAMEDAFADSENNKNTDGMAAYYADDARTMPVNEPTLDGKSAILERIMKNQESDTSGNKVRFEVVEVFADGDLVVEIGRSTTTDPDGNETYGKWMSLLERRDGKLVCIRDIFNNDQAKKETATQE